MEGFAVSCPLCSRVFEDDGGYAAHLDQQHGLTDDDGTATTMEQAFVSSGGWAAMAVVAPVPSEQLAAAPVEPRRMVVDLASVDRDRIFDPQHDDARWRVLVIGLSGLALLALVIASGTIPD